MDNFTIWFYKSKEGVKSYVCSSYKHIILRRSVSKKFRSELKTESQTSHFLTSDELTFCYFLKLAAVFK